MKTGTQRIDGQQWYYEIHGSGKPVLLLHGFTGSSASWHSLLDDLPSGYQWILVDVLGHGKSDAPPDASAYQMGQMVASLLALMTQLGHSQFACLGYSMGGRIALAMALTSPMRVPALVLESASPGLRTETEQIERRQRDHALADRIEQHGVAAFINEWEKIPLFQTQQSLSAATLVKQRDVRLSQRATGLAGSLRGLGTGEQPSYWGTLGECQCRVLLVTGTLDVKFTGVAHDIVGLFPQAQHAQIAGAGHTVHLEAPAQFVRVVSDFLMNSW